MYDYEKREAAQKRYERTLDLIIWCAVVSIVFCVAWMWF